LKCAGKNMSLKMHQGRPMSPDAPFSHIMWRLVHLYNVRYVDFSFDF
jgi:hypothetical protein